MIRDGGCVYTRNDPRHSGRMARVVSFGEAHALEGQRLHAVVRLARNLVFAQTISASYVVWLGCSAVGTSTARSGRASPLDPLLVACSTAHPLSVCNISVVAVVGWRVEPFGQDRAGLSALPDASTRDDPSVREWL